MRLKMFSFPALVVFIGWLGLGSVIALELTQSQKAAPEAVMLKQQIRTLNEQLYAAELRSTQCALSLADYQFKERAGKLANEGQALDVETIKALGGDPLNDSLDDTRLALKPRPQIEKK